MNVDNETQDMHYFFILVNWTTIYCNLHLQEEIFKEFAYKHYHGILYEVILVYIDECYHLHMNKFILISTVLKNDLLVETIRS